MVKNHYCRESAEWSRSQHSTLAAHVSPRIYWFARLFRSAHELKGFRLEWKLRNGSKLIISIIPGKKPPCFDKERNKGGFLLECSKTPKILKEL